MNEEDGLHALHGFDGSRKAVVQGLIARNERLLKQRHHHRAKLLARAMSEQALHHALGLVCVHVVTPSGTWGLAGLSRYSICLPFARAYSISPAVLTPM